MQSNKAEQSFKKTLPDSLSFRESLPEEKSLGLLAKGEQKEGAQPGLQWEGVPEAGFNSSF